MNPDYEKAFGNNISSLRISKDLTQEQLSAKLQVNGCDITHSALANIEVEQRHLYLDEIKLLIEILDISYDELFIYTRELKIFQYAGAKLILYCIPTKFAIGYIILLK